MFTTSVIDNKNAKIINGSVLSVMVLVNVSVALLVPVNVLAERPALVPREIERQIPPKTIDATGESELVASNLLVNLNPNRSDKRVSLVPLVLTDGKSVTNKKAEQHGSKAEKNPISVDDMHQFYKNIFQIVAFFLMGVFAAGGFSSSTTNKKTKVA